VIGGALLVGVLGIVALGGAGAYFIHQSASESQRKIAVEEEEARRLADEKAKINKQLKEQQARIDGLLSQLTSAKDEATRLALQKQLEEEREKQNKLRTGGGGPRPAGGGAAKPCNCQPADPLCSCL
jgi:colicin import membrane protein